MVEELMTRLAERELSAIAGIDSILASERDAHLAVLLRGLRTAHQAGYGQLAAFARLQGLGAGQEASWTSVLRRMELKLADLLPGAITLRALRPLEDELLRAYTERRDAAEGFEREVFASLASLAIRRKMLLTAHVAHATGNETLARELPRPVREYFATGEHRTCMRCLLDRPGTNHALLREKPHTFVCAACHDETIEALPPDLASLFHRWSAEAREARVLDRALTHSSKRRAQDEVHTVLAGLEPKLRPRGAALSAQRHAGPSGPSERIPTTIDRSSEEAGPIERAYDDLLFDYRTLRERW
jgi:hypothetical protein